MKNKCLIIVCSPFQLICALEAILYFKIKNFKFLLPLIGKEQNSNSECKELLREKNLNFEEFRFSSYSEQFNYLLNNKMCQYNQIICGDYIDLNQRLLAHFFCKKRSKIIFVDDGNSTLKIFEKGFSLWKDMKPLRKFKLFLINVIHKPKKSDVFFFSIFDSDIKKNVLKNDLSSLKCKICNEQKGIYILGTVSSLLNPILKDSSIETYLEKVILYLKEKYPNEQIFYYPHRRDKSNDNINSIIRAYDITLLKVKISVEMDFIKQQINPLIIIGFGSTALFTLKKIYENSQVLSIPIITTNEQLNGEYRLIETKYFEIGIKTLSIN